MTAAFALQWLKQMLWVATITGAPPILTAVIIGLLIAIFQAATQINDSALAFAPKALASIVALVIAAPWMLDRMTEFTIAAITTMARVHP